MMKAVQNGRCQYGRWYASLKDLSHWCDVAVVDTCKTSFDFGRKNFWMTQKAGDRMSFTTARWMSGKTDDALGTAESSEKNREHIPDRNNGKNKDNMRCDSDAQEGIRDRVLKTAMQHVSSLGFSNAAMEKAVRDLNISPAVLGAFSGGADAGLVQHFNTDCNRKLKPILLEKIQTSDMPTIRNRLYTGVRTRLEMLAPFIDAWPEALAIQARPSQVPVTLRNYEEIADIIWRASGDRSVDFSWYTRRGLLMALYGATELFMLTDCSPQFSDTWSALTRRLEDLQLLGIDLDKEMH